MMSALAVRMSRKLVACYPRRWRQRYGEEMLDVLDQHRPTARTVLNLAAGAVSTHLDPAYRTERPARIGLSVSQVAAIAFAAAGLAIFTVMLIGAWQEDTWHLSGAGGVAAVAFAPGQRLLVSAVGEAGQDSMDTVWDITDPARPRPLSAFQGGEPTALSPDGRTVATVAFSGQTALWDVASPPGARPGQRRCLPATAACCGDRRSPRTAGSWPPPITTGSSCGTWPARPGPGCCAAWTPR